MAAVIVGQVVIGAPRGSTNCSSSIKWSVVRSIVAPVRVLSVWGIGQS
jgi:hypothetical protein